LAEAQLFFGVLCLLKNAIHHAIAGPHVDLIAAVKEDMAPSYIPHAPLSSHTNLIAHNGPRHQQSWILAKKPSDMPVVDGTSSDQTLNSRDETLKDKQVLLKHSTVQ
jgi:hypothetical protein